MKRRIISLIVAAVLTLSIPLPSMAVNTEKSDINEIYVKYDASDATDNIAAALLEARMTPGRDRVILSNPGKGKVWSSGPIFIGSNVEFYIEPDTVLEAKEGAFPHFKQSFVNIIDQSNVTIIGGDNETSVIRMRLEEYTDGEWRSCVYIAGGTGVIVRNLSIAKSGGDAVTVSDVDLLSNHPTGPNKNVIIENCICDGHARNGMSIISGSDIIVNNCKITNTGKYNPAGVAASGPWAGIDVETEARKVVDNITLANIEIDSPKRNGITINVTKQPSATYNLDVLNCRMTNVYTNGFNIMTKKPKVTGNVNIENCIVNTASYGALMFREWGATGHTSIKDCMFINASDRESGGLFDFYGNPTLDDRAAEFDLGNISFENVYCVKTIYNKVLKFEGGNEKFKIKDITGEIYVDNEASVVENLCPQYCENVDLKLLPVERPLIEVYEEIIQREDIYQERAAEIIAKIEAEIEADIEKQKNAVEEVMVKVDGSVVDFEDQFPLIENDRTLVPLRKIFEKMGAEVNWNGDTRTVTATKGETVISLTIDNTVAVKNGKEIILDVPPRIINGRTLVPLRFVTESLGGLVTWEGDQRTVFIENIGEIIPQIRDGNEIVIHCNTEGYHENGIGWLNRTVDGKKTRQNTYNVFENAYTPWAKFTPEITEEGNYDVYVWKVVLGDGDKQAGFEIVYDTDTLLKPEPPTQNWTEGESGWVKITEVSGPLHFTPQSSSGTQYVKIKKTKGGGKNYMRVAAVKLVKVD